MYAGNAGAIASIVGRMHLSTKMHDYMDVGGRVMHGAITEEQFSAKSVFQTSYNLRIERLRKALRE